jgi:hypothetical protein
MIYDLSILGLRPNTLGPVLSRLPETVPAAIRSGKLLGCFMCEFGVLNRIAVLSAYETAEALYEDRTSIVDSGNPYGVNEYLGAFERGSYQPLPFMKDIVVGDYGPFYEMRTYGIGPGGLPTTSDAWAKVVPRRNEMSRLLMVMSSIEPGAQRMVHIWPYKTLDARTSARAMASKEGIWPPPGGSDHLTSLQSELFVATKFSPLS